jgi:hypothetical protein
MALVGIFRAKKSFCLEKIIIYVYLSEFLACSFWINNFDMAIDTMNVFCGHSFFP